MSQREAVTTLAAGLAALGLAACGGSGDNPKVGDASAFVGKCEKQAQHPMTSNAQLAQFVKTHATPICTCIQQKFASAGLGDKRYNDKALKNRSEPDECGQQALTGRSSSGGGYFPGG